MRNRIITAVAGAVALLSASQVFAVEQVIEGFENSADPARWQQVSPAPGQIRNATNTNVDPGAPPTYLIGTHVTEGLNSGQFPIAWTLPGADPATANVFISGGPTFYWAMRNNITTPANLSNNSLPNASAILRADVFNNSADTVKFALYVQDSAGTGGLERGPFVDLPPNASTTYQWDFATQPATGWVTGNGTLDGSNSVLKGFFVYTETAPTATPLLLDVDNIRVDAQLDLTAPAAPVVVSAKQGAAPGEVIVTWIAGSEPDLAGYKIYLAADSDFGSVIGNRFTYPSTPTATVTNPAATTVTLTGVPTETNVYIKVNAYDNATPSSNESLSDVILGVNLAADGSTPEDLVVLDLDAYPVTDGNFTTNGYLHGIVYWAQSLSAQTRNFQSCRANAITSANVALSSATGVVYWTTGRDGEATADQTLTSANETAISSFLTGGGNLLLTGTSLGEDLTTNGDPADQTFYSSVLKAALANENTAQSGVDADVTNFPTAGGFFTATEAFNVAAGSNLNNEALTAQGSAVGALTYTGITPGNAAILDSNSLVYFGFAFETVRDVAGASSAFGAARDKRTALLTDAVAYLTALPPSQAQNNWSIYE